MSFFSKSLYGCKPVLGTLPAGTGFWISSPNSICIIHTLIFIIINTTLWCGSVCVLPLKANYKLNTESFNHIVCLLALNERRLDLREMCVSINIVLFCDVTTWTLAKDGESEVSRNVGAHYQSTECYIPVSRHLETVRVFIQRINRLVSVMDIQYTVRLNIKQAYILNEFENRYIVLYCGRVPAANAPGCTAAEGLLYKPWSLVVPICTARCLHQRP